MLKMTLVKIQRPDNDISVNIIIGMSHFIKTAEDLEETLTKTVPGIKFGLAFCEASGGKLIRYTGTDKSMIDLAVRNAKLIRAGHSFIIFLKDTFPIKVLPAIKNVEEVCTIFCATANPVEMIIAESESGRGIIGVIDGQTNNQVETEKDIIERKEFLRKIGYKT